MGCCSLYGQFLIPSQCIIAAICPCMTVQKLSNQHVHCMHFVVTVLKLSHNVGIVYLNLYRSPFFMGRKLNLGDVY